jgi:hypothetical protein
MKVEAIRLGYYDMKRRRPGQVFVLKSEKEFSKEWMAAVDGNGPKAKKLEPKQKPKVAESVADTEVI